MLLASILLACTANEGTQSADTEWISGIETATSEEIPSVIEVRFSTPEDAVAWIEFGDENLTRSTAVSALSTEHSFAVVGASPLSEVTMRVVVQVDGEEHHSGVFSHESGGLLPETPTFEIMIDNYDPPEEAVLLMSVYSDPTYLVMLNFDGEVVWSKSNGGENDGHGLGILPVNGEIQYNFFENVWDNGQFNRMSLSGDPIETVDTPDSHHFFTAGPNGEPAWIQYTAEPQGNGSPVLGDSLVIGTGEDARELFSTWDHLTFQPDPGNLPEWTHANGIEYSADRDSYLMSTAFADTLIEMDTEGNPLRIIGGLNSADSDYQFEDEDDTFSYPHGVRWTSKGDLLLFSTIDNVTRANRYELNDETGIISKRWEFGADDGHEAHVLGEAHELDDGNILLSWGSVGILQVVDPATDTILWEARSALQEFPTQVHYLDSPYTTR
ncbi:MAG: hypothetical protein ACI8RZ_000408 [Myxococcota bacterium]|jgi:hypothetical protein